MQKKIVNIVSNLRISSDYTAAYINQLLALKQENYQLGKIILVCDDILSSNSVANWTAIDSRVILIQEEKADGAVVTLEEKTLQWASLCNQGIDKSTLHSSDYTLFLEADLTIPFDLVEELVSANLDICAPVIFLGAGFYDSWGFRDLNGNKIFSLQGLDVFYKPVELSSVGSCVLFKTDVFNHGIRFRGPYQTGLLVGVCNDARLFGYNVWMLPHLSIVHPTSAWRNQTWRIIEIEFDHPLFAGKIDCSLMVSGAYQEFVEIEVRKFIEQIKKFSGFNVTISFVKNERSRTLLVKIKD